MSELAPDIEGENSFDDYGVGAELQERVKAELREQRIKAAALAAGLLATAAAGIGIGAFRARHV